MVDLPKLSIVLLTCKRLDVALRTIQSTCRNLGYPRELVSWYIADDGSPLSEFEEMRNILTGLGQSVVYSHRQRMRHPGEENTYFAGMGWNKALGIAHQNSDFVLQLEDDWELEQPFDIVPYVDLLQRNESVGIVTFRILSVGCDVHTVGDMATGIHFLRYQRTTQYAYSGNPHIRHARFVKHYGWFDEHVNPGGIELKQDDQYRLDVNNGPWIWRPTAIDPWGAWHHIGKDKSWS